MRLLGYFLAGWLIGQLAVPLGAQTAQVMFGVFSGAPKSLSVTSAGVVNVAVN